MRQAVVIVHGIGEQRPMSTLRAFVKAVIPEPAVEGRARYHNKPDRLSETFELRRLQGLSSRRAPTTDYYEFYWAYHSEGTRFAHILTWLRTLLLRTPGQVPERLLPTWLLAWCLIATAAILWLANPSAEMSIPSIPGIPERWTLPLATLLLIPLSQYLALHYIGDAARYLDPAALRGVDDERPAFEGDTRQPARHQPDLVADQHERSEIEMPGPYEAVAQRRTRRQRQRRLGNIV